MHATLTGPDRTGHLRQKAALFAESVAENIACFAADAGADRDAVNARVVAMVGKVGAGAALQRHIMLTPIQLDILLPMPISCRPAPRTGPLSASDKKPDFSRLATIV
jgi:hypothetical protein